MAKVLLTSTALAPRDNDRLDLNYVKKMQGAYHEAVKSASVDQFGIHHLVSTPEEAEIILFVELDWAGLFAERIRWHPWVRRYREKCFLFDRSDFSYPFLPGLYASLRKQFHDPARTRTGHYMTIEQNPYIGFRPLDPTSPYLGSFIGSFKNSPVRVEIGKLPRDRFLLEDTSTYAKAMQSGGAQDDRHRFWKKYADAMEAAHFSLCPRGLGPGSIRLFESMQMGRCPVILSDESVPAPHVDWASCSLTVAEKDASRLPETLTAHLADAEQLGRNARREWERYYAPTVQFHWLIESCLELKEGRRVSEAIASRLIWRYTLNPPAIRRYLTSKRQMLLDEHKLLL